MTPNCIFCDDTANDYLDFGTAVARWDGYPVSPGHTLIRPKRHVVSFFDLSVNEMVDMYALAGTARGVIAEHLNRDPDGFTIGVNEGIAAGRTVHHLHMHLIPRHHGDHRDPRGGIRNIFPTAPYRPEEWTFQ